MTPTGDTIGQKARARRKALGISQADLAALAGVSRKVVVAVEADHATVKLQSLTTVLDILGLRLEVT